MQGVSRAEIVAKELLKKYQGAFISKRDGLVIIKIRTDGKTEIIWIRQRPITDKALNLFKKIISKHKYDKLTLLKLYEGADYVKFDELDIFDEVKT